MRSILSRYVLCVTMLACASGETAGSSDTVKAQGSVAPSNADAPSPLAQPSPAASSRRTILFVGTSLTAGYGLEPDSAYPQQIQRLIDAERLPYDVVNAGVSGETSSALVRRLDWLLRQPIDVIVIETGANDGLRGIPVETMKANIQLIIERVRAVRPGARIVLAQMEAMPNLGTAYTRRFREAFPEVARANDVTLLPFILEGVAGHRDLNQADGIHPDYAGERIVTQNVWKGLRPLLH